VGKDRTAFWRKTAGRGLFWAGFALVVMRWGLVGAIVQIVGLFVLFGAFLASALGMARNLPWIGPILRLPGVSAVVDMLAGKSTVAVDRHV